MSYVKQNKKRKQTLKSAQYRLEIIFNGHLQCTTVTCHSIVDFGPPKQKDTVKFGGNTVTYFFN